MERVELTRECEAVQVPLGSPITLEKGLEVFITQSLGGSFTVQVPAYGGLYRITGKDADALGKSSADAASPAAASGDLEAMVWEQLKTCYDPEIPVNIVELGLVYLNEVTELPGSGFKVAVKFTLTAPGCGMGPVLQKEVETKIASVPGVKESKAEVVFEPAWDRNMMSEAAKLRLGIF
jgi:probable FeS assembly SUF system protein SufT